jgi:hypothetical protein
MYILARSNPLENHKNSLYRFQDAALEAIYFDAGYHIHERRYEIKCQHKVYFVICSEFRDDANGAEPIVVIPDFVVPGRPYPIYVYLHAIELYSGNPEKGQRWAAGETRRLFGLATFAHTTLGRALKAFVREIGGGVKAADGAPAVPADAGGGKKRSFPSAQATAGLRKQAARFLGGLLGRARREQFVGGICGLARQRHREHCRFLL